MNKILLSLIVGFVGLISFGSAGFINLITQNIAPGSVNVDTGQCVYMSSPSPFIKLYENNIENSLESNYAYCFSSPGYIQNTSSSNKSVMLFNISSEFPTCQVCEEQYTSEQCQSEYSLMPIDSCNSEYCEMNDLCSTIGGSGSSTLYINDVRHEAAPFIYVNIPEEFKRDYLTGEQEFTINVEGLNGDQDYINGIIDVNSFRPSSEDFTQTFVGGLTLIFPYIIITAVILFIRRFIRKIFK